MLAHKNTLCTPNYSIATQHAILPCSGKFPSWNLGTTKRGTGGKDVRGGYMNPVANQKEGRDGGNDMVEKTPMKWL